MDQFISLPSIGNQKPVKNLNRFLNFNNILPNSIQNILKESNNNCTLNVVLLQFLPAAPMGKKKDGPLHLWEPKMASLDVSKWCHATYKSRCLLLARHNFPDQMYHSRKKHHRPEQNFSAPDVLSSTKDGWPGCCWIHIDFSRAFPILARCNHYIHTTH